jgi:hypothetical protein
VALLEPVPGKGFSCPPFQTGSINAAFNALFARGMPAMLELVEANLVENLAALATAQAIMKFTLDHPAVRNALAINFGEGSNARRFIEACDAASAEEDDRAIENASHGFSATERHLMEFLDFFEDGVTQEAASRALAQCQCYVTRLSKAKGALMRAMAM